MYKQFFKLNSAPFKITPDTDCFFSEGNRKAILEGLIYTICNGDGITKVIGEVGSGKTLLSRILAKSLPENCAILYLLNPRISVDNILYAIALELGLTFDQTPDRIRLLHELHSKLLELHQNNKQAILLIDEAQAMPLETLEEIRMLSNLETGQQKLLQIVLFGQPELDKKLNRHEVRQIKERIIHNFTLPQFSNSEVNRYLYFRLQNAGFQGVFPFTTLAVLLITIKSNGFLRRVNILADKCLLAAFSKQAKKVTASTVLQVIFENSKFPKKFFALTFASLALMVYATVESTDFLNQNAINSAQSTEIILPVNSQNKQSLNKIPIIETNIASETTVMPNNQKKDYTIQLLSLVLSKNQDIITNLKTIIPQDLWHHNYYYYKTSRVYQIFLGSFSNVQEALPTLQYLPKSLRKNKPFIVKKTKISRKYLTLKLNST